MLELLGLGKQDVLVEETLSMQLVRLLRGAMADHPVIVAAKRRPAQDPGEARRAEIQILAAPSRVTAGQSADRAVAHSQHRGGRVAHRPARRRHRRFGWAFSCSPPTSGCSIGTFYRHDLAGPVAPGQTIDVDLACPVPDARGPHYLKFDLVEEGVTWFEPQGSAIARHAIEVI